MDTITVQQEIKIGSFATQTNAVTEEDRYSSLADFMKGTISSEELVKFVCGKLDEKYAPCGASVPA